ncbi:MAG: fibrinogen-like YCDxxxxGGGW domain-containing protein [Myxococcales bacterium]|nr:fibrinogen-like YCDxxxxGGGW domain-containing protein [Myxococcales bacterium]
MLAIDRRVVGATLPLLLLGACSDGSAGSGFAVARERDDRRDASVRADGGGPDGGADGSVDAALPDSDSDGVPDQEDLAPSNPNGCGDTDVDTCDDCSGGHFDPDNDGTDTNGDGVCDACDVALCSAQGACVIDEGVARCRCEEGWSGDDCRTDVDECSRPDNPCRAAGDSQATCSNTGGSYVCSCSRQGFTALGGTCMPPDACRDQDNPCDDGDDPDAGCQSAEDGEAYTCRCSGPGFDSASGICVDVDECEQQDNPCDDGEDLKASCVNNTGGYGCECSPGFVEAKGTCTAAGACAGEDACSEAGDVGAVCMTDPDDQARCQCSPGVGGARCQRFQASCQAIQQAGLSQGDGKYVIDPSGDAPFEVACDMTTEGGGWTAVTPATARSGFGGKLTALSGGTCDFNGDNPRARHAGDDVLCRYDIDLGFEFNRVRLVDGTVTSRAGSGSTSELSHNTDAWGTADCVPETSGDVRLGMAQDAAGALSLAAVNGQAPCSGISLQEAGEQLAFSGDTMVQTGSVLRMELGESGENPEGWEWTGGTIFVRREPQLIGAHAVGDPARWSDGSVSRSCEDYRRPLGGIRLAVDPPNGIYTIDPDGEGSSPAFDVYCDMTTDDGGWTLLAVISGADEDHWNVRYGAWVEESALGNLADLNGDYRSPAWHHLDLRGAEVLFERRFDGQPQAQTVLASECVAGASRFAELFAEPTQTGIACRRDAIRNLNGSATGVASDAFAEGSGRFALGGRDTNGFCWNGGDTEGRQFEGHLVWNQKPHLDGCLASSHLGGLGVYRADGDRLEQADFTQTSWLDGVGGARVAVRLYARDVPTMRGDGSNGAPFQALSDPAPSTCTAFLRYAGGKAHSGVYLLDPDGSGGGAPEATYCNMHAAGGGFRRLLRWSRESDPSLHTLASLQAALIDELGAADGVSTMGQLHDEVDHIHWSDGDFSHDALAYALDVAGSAGSEVLVDLHYEGSSMETSGVWFFASGDTQTRNLVCFDDTGDASYSAAEAALRPYACEVDSPRSFVWDGPFVLDLGEPVRRVHIRSLHHDEDRRDESSLYRFDVYTR